MLAWSTTGRPTAGFLWYMHEIYLGSTKGYAGTFSPNARNIYLSMIYNEGQGYYFASLSDGDITLKSTDRIRMEVSSHDGQTFVMTVFNQLEPNTPWASAIGQDATYAGIGGSAAISFSMKIIPRTMEPAPRLTTTPRANRQRTPCRRWSQTCIRRRPARPPPFTPR